MIKRIKNLKYSPSKNKENILWLEADAKKLRILAETDWTQLPDINLTTQSKTQWKMWRKSVRGLHKSTHTIEEFNDILSNLIEDRDGIPINYVQFTDIDRGKEYLHKLLISKYNSKINEKVSPSLGVKYQEALDVISLHCSTNECADIGDMDAIQLAEYIENLPELKVDIDGFPFFKLTMQLKNCNINQTIGIILRESHMQFNFSLHEEYNLLHYEHRITSCDTIKDIYDTEVEIELNYGH